MSTGEPDVSEGCALIRPWLMLVPHSLLDQCAWQVYIWWDSSSLQCHCRNGYSLAAKRSGSNRAIYSITCGSPHSGL